MKKLKGDIAADLLAPAVLGRFRELFAVASRKSIFGWRDVPPALAQVVFLDHSASAVQLNPGPACVVWVGAEPSAASTRAHWTGRLAQDYTVGDLIDILDRAAVFLMDWKGATPLQGRALAPVPPQADEVQHSLNAWVSMGAPFDSAECIRALALLARGGVTPEQLRAHSGLDTASMEALLRELDRRGVLTTVAAPAAVAVRAPGPASAHRRLVRRLSHWLRGASGVGRA